MKSMKNVIESAAVLCMTGALAITAVTGSDKAVGQAERNSGLENVGIAGVANVLNGYEQEMGDSIEQLTVEKENKDVVAAAMETAEMQGTAKMLPMQSTEKTAQPTEETTQSTEETAQPTEKVADATAQPTEKAAQDAAGVQPRGEKVHDAEAEKPKLTKEEKEWQDKLMADVKDFLNVRASKDKDAKIVGKLRKGDVADIVKSGKKWTKIKSGNVTGYVQNKYCVMGSDALAYAKENCDMVAKVEINGLRIRKEQNTESRILKITKKGNILTVDTKADTDKEWVAVSTGSTKGYVSAEFVTLSYQTGRAISIEEEKAAIEAAKKEKARQAAKSTAVKTTQGKAVEVSTDDETLLAAIIQCEAGNQSYECQLAVGAVVMNRVKSSRYPNSISKVVYQRRQFGPARNGSLSRRLSNGVSSTARKAAKAALSGTDNTGGCLYFNVASAGHSGLKIGAVVFW